MIVDVLYYKVQETHMNLIDFDRWSIELKSTAESVHASVQLNLPEISLLKLIHWS